MTEAKWKVAASTGRLPAPITLLVPSIFFTCCHLSLSTCGGREHAVSQAWHHTAVVKWGVSVANQKRSFILCMNKTFFSVVQLCMSVKAQEMEEANKNYFCHPCGQQLQLGFYKKTCNRSYTSQWTNVGCAYFAHRQLWSTEILVFYKAVL